MFGRNSTRYMQCPCCDGNEKVEDFVNSTRQMTYLIDCPECKGKGVVKINV
jgi:hypothetical protein